MGWRRRTSGGTADQYELCDPLGSGQRKENGPIMFSLSADAVECPPLQFRHLLQWTKGG